MLLNIETVPCCYITKSFHWRSMQLLFLVKLYNFRDCAFISYKLILLFEKKLNMELWRLVLSEIYCIPLHQTDTCNVTTMNGIRSNKHRTRMRYISVIIRNICVAANYETRCDRGIQLHNYAKQLRIKLCTTVLVPVVGYLIR